MQVMACILQRLCLKLLCNINGIYSRDVLVKGTVLNNAAKTPVTFNEPWGFSGNLGYQTHLVRMVR